MEPNHENRRRQAARRKAAAKRKQQQLLMLCAFLVIVFCALLVFLLVTVFRSPVYDTVTLEAGSPVAMDTFLRKSSASARFISDISYLNTDVPGNYEILIDIDGKTHKSVLQIRDTIAPTAEAWDLNLHGVIVPDPRTLVYNIRDVSDVDVRFETPIDVTVGGERTVNIVLTDTSGNFTLIPIKVNVILDETAPVISEVPYKEHWVYLGDSIQYKSYVTFTDDRTAADKLTLTVNRDSVDTTKAGTYPIIYTVKDEAGNQASITIELTIKDKPTGYVEPEVAYGYAKQVLSQITTEGMSKAQIAAAIYNYVRHNLSYSGSSDKNRGWAAGAVDGFTRGTGDCYTYYATAKALFDVAGIPNVDVVKVKTAQTSDSSHYWSLIDVGNGWYHVDCTPRAGVYDESFFLYTDEEMLAFSRANKNCFNFDLNAYPARQTASVQSHIRFSSLKVSIIESW